MRPVYKRTLQLSSRIIVEHLQLDRIFPELETIRGIQDLLEKVKNINRNETRRAAIDTLLSGLQLFDDNAYETFVAAAGLLSFDIANEILKNKELAEEEMTQQEIRRQRLMDAKR